MHTLTQVLDLGFNNIGDDGMRSLADAFAKGALKNCTQLFLSDNKIGNDGMCSLADALANGALAPRAMVGVQDNNATEAGKQAVRDATKGCGRKVYI